VQVYRKLIIENSKNHKGYINKQATR